MIRFVALSAVVLIAACDTNPPRIDDYRYVAYSWTGGNINKMIDVWGEPNRGLTQATGVDPGMAHWRSFSRVGVGGTADSYRYFCDMTVYFDAAGMISEVRIHRADHCKTLYGDEIRGMLRPGVKPPPTWETS